MSQTNSRISRALHEWGVDKERLKEKPEDLLFSLTSKLNELGLQVGLATACIRTPHPQLDMLVFRWRPLTTEEVPTTSTRSIVGQRTIKRPRMASKTFIIWCMVIPMKRCGKAVHSEKLSMKMIL